MRLTFGQVERVLMRLHGVESDRRRITLRSRLQHLQRANFPPGVAVGRGRKFDYGADQFFQLVFALELAVARVPPVHATRIVLEGWSVLRRFADDAWSRHSAGQMAGSVPPDRWCLIVPRGLDALRSDDVEEVVETVQAVPADVVAGWMLGAGGAPPRSMVLLDLQDAAMRALEAAGIVKAAPPEPAGGM